MIKVIPFIPEYELSFYRHFTVKENGGKVIVRHLLFLVLKRVENLKFIFYVGWPSRDSSFRIRWPLL